MIAFDFDQENAAEVLHRLHAGCVSRTFRLKYKHDSGEIFVAIAADSDTALACAQQILEAMESKLRPQDPERFE